MRVVVATVEDRNTEGHQRQVAGSSARSGKGKPCRSRDPGPSCEGFDVHGALKCSGSVRGIGRMRLLASAALRKAAVQSTDKAYRWLGIAALELRHASS